MPRPEMFSTGTIQCEGDEDIVPLLDLLRENAIMEQRREDSAALANKLKQEIDWETPWEKEQRLKKQPPAATDPQAKPAAAPAPTTLPSGRADDDSLDSIPAAPIRGVRRYAKTGKGFPLARFFGEVAAGYRVGRRCDASRTSLHRHRAAACE